MILIILVLVSAYAYPQDDPEPSDEAPNQSNDTLRTAQNNGECRQVSEQIICSHIPDNAGEFVANYINSNSVSKRTFLFIILRKYLAILVRYKSDDGSTNKNGGYEQNERSFIHLVSFYCLKSVLTWLDH